MVVIFQNGRQNIHVLILPFLINVKKILVFKYTFSGPRPMIKENNLKYISKWSDKCLFCRSIYLFTNNAANMHGNAFRLIQADIGSI